MSSPLNLPTTATDPVTAAIHTTTPTLLHPILFEALRYEEFIFICVAAAILIAVGVMYVVDVTQKTHTIRRNYPVIGRLRYLMENLGEFLRQYFFANDREELPFNRTERSWVYRAAKNVENVVGFGSTRDFKPIGTVFFVNTPFPVLGRDAVEPHAVTIGPHCKSPYTTHSFFNISAMSYGAISKPAVLALSKGAKMAGIWMNTGEGGISPYHLEGGADLIAQIGTAKYGYCNEKGELDDDLLRKAAAHKQVKMFEVKLSQGAKPGKGGVLPAVKVTPEIAAIRHIKPYTDSISPNRFPEISNVKEMLDFAEHIRNVTGKPVGLKFVLGSYEWLDDFCLEILRRGKEHAPDFVTLDSSAGGTGAAPLSLVDNVGLPIEESLPVLVDTLIRYGLRDRIKVIAAGKLITPSEVAWALCVGADFINSARGFLFALGCIQALRCHLNTCPTGITTHDKHKQRGLDVTDKSLRVYHYATNMAKEVGIISHSCGVHEPRELCRHHARIVSDDGRSISLAKFFPEPKVEFGEEKI